MKRISLSFTLLFSSLVSANSSGVDVVKQFVTAFNNKNIEAMLLLSDPDISWMSVAGQQVSVEATSKNALKDAMVGYFKSIPSARSELKSISEDGPFVHTIEQAFWQSGSIEKSQCSMAIYQLEHHKISRVWYFPSYQCEQ